MKNEISPLKLDEIKVVAKRLKEHLPDIQHMKRLDIASYLITGTQSFRDAQKLSENILVKRQKRNSADGDILPNKPLQQTQTYGQSFDEVPSFKKGDWYFYPKNNALVFDGEFSPYSIELIKLNTTSMLLDSILQIQKKKWHKSQIEGTSVSPTYQVDEFISLVNDLCLYYFNNTVQSVFSPSGVSKTVNWLDAIANKNSLSNTEAH